MYVCLSAGFREVAETVHARTSRGCVGWISLGSTFVRNRTNRATEDEKNIYKRASREGRVTETRVDDWTRTKKNIRRRLQR